LHADSHEFPTQKNLVKQRQKVKQQQQQESRKMKKGTSVEVNEDLGIYMEQYVSREEQQHEPPYF
jgi:hypothetical protein